MTDTYRFSAPDDYDAYLERLERGFDAYYNHGGDRDVDPLVVKLAVHIVAAYQPQTREQADLIVKTLATLSSGRL
ncbi:MAG: hypothetical protein GEV10_13760 [Streptosporangiales bacterium]|nr:hypothetical protein [Streptosporangiales bacterium]